MLTDFSVSKRNIQKLSQFKILLLKSNKCTLLVTSTLNKIKVTLKVTDTNLDQSKKP
jgi:hypothetical protein